MLIFDYTHCQLYFNLHISFHCYFIIHCLFIVISFHFIVSYILYSLLAIFQLATCLILANFDKSPVSKKSSWQANNWYQITGTGSQKMPDYSGNWNRNSGQTLFSCAVQWDMAPWCHIPLNGTANILFCSRFLFENKVYSVNYPSGS